MAKKTPTKKPVKSSKKAVVKKTAIKAVPKKTVVKAPAKKPSAKSMPKKPVAKAPAKKVANKVKTPAKKAPAKKTGNVQTKKPLAKKTPVKKVGTKAPVKIAKKQAKQVVKQEVKNTKKTPSKPTKQAVKKPSKSAKKEASSVKEKKAQTNKKVQKEVKSEGNKTQKTIASEIKTLLTKEESVPSFRTDRPTHHIAFSLEDLDAYFKDMANNVHPKLSKKDFRTNTKKKNLPKKTAKGVIKLENKSEGVATIFDILGFNPVETQSIEKLEEKDVPRKWKKYYKKLVELRNHHTQGVTSRSEEVMKRSAKDDAGDLSSNGQHLADAGSASFERDLAYNMITNQTEILSEIDAAIKRIKDGTYGVCEVTGKPIPEARLEAIPFARYTIEGQEIHELEQKRAKAIRRESVFDMGIDVSGNPQKSEEEDSDVGM